jgi:hypothetical protein
MNHNNPLKKGSQVVLFVKQVGTELEMLLKGTILQSRKSGNDTEYAMGDVSAQNKAGQVSKAPVQMENDKVVIVLAVSQSGNHANVDIRSASKQKTYVTFKVLKVIKHTEVPSSDIQTLNTGEDVSIPRKKPIKRKMKRPPYKKNTTQKRKQKKQTTKKKRNTVKKRKTKKTNKTKKRKVKRKKKRR